MRYYFAFAIMLIVLSVNSCSNNLQNSFEQSADLVYHKPGLVDSIVGTCSSFLVRNFTLDTLDMSGYNKCFFEKDAFTDGDRSEVIVYYLNADTAVTLVRLSGIREINSPSLSEFTPPKRNTAVFLRMKLFASVCTGQLYNLKLRNIKISGNK